MKKKQEDLFNQEPSDAESLSQEIALIVPIRRESAISQFPFHRLSKSKEPMQIALVTEGKRGKVTTTWEVSGNTKYGDPGILAYKIDTLIINRLVDEARPNIPRVLKLGSLRELARELDLGGDTKTVKKALYQNASAFITANLLFQGTDGAERKFEFGSTRYKVFFVGDKLPNGRRADAVYVSFDDSFHEMLKQARTRPLDYAYLKALPPASQRLYELIAPQIYASIKNGNPRAKFAYSDFCMRAPLTRYDDWEHVKKQLYKVHLPHKASGYISKVEFEETTDVNGRVDWVMWYTAGRKAKAEFRRFNSKEGKELDRQDRIRPHLVKVEVLPTLSSLLLEEGIEETVKPENQKTRKPENSLEEQTLMTSLVEQGITEAKAKALVENHREAVERELEAWTHRDKSKMKDPSAWLIKAIESGDYSQPQAVEKKRKIKAFAEQKKREEEQIERLRVVYAEFLKAELKALKKKDKDQYEAFATSFAKEWERMSKIAGEDKRPMMELHHLEWFAGWHRDFPIITFEEWRERQKEIA